MIYRSIFRTAGLLTAAAVVCAIGLPAEAFSTDASTGPAVAPSVAAVTYSTGSSVYINAGRKQGLAVGSRLTVHRDGEVIATLEVSHVSTNKASCKTIETIQIPTPGDEVQFIAVALPETAVSTSALDQASADEPKPKRARTLRSRGIRGRIGARYLQVDDRSTGASNYTQPSLDLRLDGTQINGSPWGMNVDVRSRRTLRTRVDGTSDNDSRTRVYRAAMTRHGTTDPYRFTVGRQFSPALSAISVFDGVSAERSQPRWGVGLFTGTQPGVADYGFATDVREHGFYFQFRGKPASKRRWALTTGLIGSYEQSEINREFVYLQGRYTGPKLFGYFTQEIDYNRGWKRDAGEPSVDPTSTFVSMNYRANKKLSFNGGFDNRRNIRLYRNFVTPETEFDDSFRQGIWSGVGIQATRRLRIAANTRIHRGGNAGDAATYTLTGSLRDLFPIRLDIRARASRYDNDLVEGNLYSMTAGIRLAKRTRLQLGGGVRDETNFGGPIPEETQRWLRLDLDVGLGDRWYLLFSADRTGGDSEEIDQYFTSVSYRF